MGNFSDINLVNPLFTGWVGFVIFCFLLLMALIWFFLPFAVYGIQEKLKRQMELAEQTNEILSLIHKELKDHSDNDKSVDQEKSPSITATRD